MVVLRALMRVAYAPLFLCGFVGLAIWMLGERQWAPLWLLVLLMPAITASFAFEAWLPYRSDWNRNRGDFSRDLVHALVNEALNVAALACIPLLAGVLPQSGLWPAQLPFWAQVLFAVVVADLGITLVHWLSHRWSPLWRLHAVHHSVRRMYGFNGLMKHPLHQSVEAIGGVLPLLLLGMPLDVAAVLTFAIAIQLLLQHGNIDMRSGVLNHVFAWAPAHRFHHLRYGRAGDVNFGLFLTVWDRLLGTAFDGRGYHLRSDDLGIGSRPDYPESYAAQLIEPFRSREERPSPPLPEALRR
jgi:sterol desaturase/sphingolipid hydroxylase (fatty acid hydroxylase superfamily)